MKRHINLKTGDIMVANLNSPEMPIYLHPSHGQLFQYQSKPRSQTHRRYLVPLQNSTSGLISPCSQIANSDSSFSLPPCDDTKIKRSFGQSSISIKMTMKDDIYINLPSVQKLKKVFYNNKIFGVNKQILIPEESCLLRNQQSSFDVNKQYIKPTQISKLTGDLNRSSILMRYDPTFCSRRSEACRSNNQLTVRKSERSPHKLSRMMKMSRIKMKQSTAASEFQKVIKIRNTIDDYKEMELHKHELDPIAFKNTMSHVLAFDQILKKIKKPVHLKSRQA